MPKLETRPFRGDDLDSISGIERKLVGDSKKNFLGKRFVSMTATPDDFLSCSALLGQKVVGYACARIEEGEFGTQDPVAVLDILGIDPDAQRNGVGKKLLAEIERQMKERGIGILRTQVDWRNQEMIRFFSSVGALLAPVKILERDTSALAQELKEADTLNISKQRKAGRGQDEVLERDQVLIRSLKEEDIASIVRIYRKHTGHDRTARYEAKFREMLAETGVRVSFVAEEDGLVVGFVMARVDLGEFGMIDKTAVLDEMGVHPAFVGSGVGHALLSQLIMNLASLRVETVFTQVTISRKHLDMLNFLCSTGFQPSQRLMLNVTV